MALSTFLKKGNYSRKKKPHKTGVEALSNPTRTLRNSKVLKWIICCFMLEFQRVRARLLPVWRNGSFEAILLNSQGDDSCPCFDTGTIA